MPGRSVLDVDRPPVGPTRDRTRSKTPPPAAPPAAEARAPARRPPSSFRRALIFAVFVFYPLRGDIYLSLYSTPPFPECPRGSPPLPGPQSWARTTP